MLCRWILFFTLAAVPGNALAAPNCLMTEALKDEALGANADFWREFAALSAKNGGAVPDKVLRDLISKHKGASETPPTPLQPQAQTFAPSNRVAIQSKAEKEIANLPANLKGKVDDFLQAALKPNGMKEIRENPGRWHLEKLPQFGPNSYSVRISSGYRVLFDYDGTGFEVRRVNKGQIHGN